MKTEAWELVGKDISFSQDVLPLMEVVPQHLLQDASSYSSTLHAGLSRKCKTIRSAVSRPILAAIVYC